jgi:hypothetical protein
MKLLIVVVVWACCAVWSSIAQPNQAVTVTNGTAAVELERVLTLLNRPGEKDSPFERPGWKDQELLARLDHIANAATNSPSSWTAQLWLAVIESDSIQAETRRPEIRRKVDALNTRLDRIIASAGNSWQAKAARISKCGSLFYARRWNECRAEIEYLLKNVATFRSEADPGFAQYVNVQGKSLDDFEPEIRFFLVMIEAMGGNYQKALEVAEQLKSSFPQWSRRTRLDGTIELLKAEKCPFHIP